jgi:hypothetical protein
MQEFTQKVRPLSCAGALGSELETPAFVALDAMRV